ncbi:hypothetical protein CC78DRAFT_613485 [Lojkania enalia]|uniref:Uncharacterized protein n=1 Tax=Lojkania enalia TaxID=147567 RepID=A0A9P4KHM1_9PLEO|nr:hypothetical protein CC78DRAFT_613485 [Didymosphaeria enalia]
MYPLRYSPWFEQLRRKTPQEPSTGNGKTISKVLRRSATSAIRGTVSVLSQHSVHHAHTFNPTTPIHSPHHSLASSTSSRTPLYTLSLHEYRKQQNTPTRPSSTPPGKALRRKAAASALNELERVSSVSHTPGFGARPSLRPLNLSHSTHHLTGHQPLPPSPPHFLESTEPHDAPPRSYSVEPREFTSFTSSWTSSTSDAAHFQPFLKNLSREKVGLFKPIKRLPKPQIAIPSATSTTSSTSLAHRPISQSRHTHLHNSSLAPVTWTRPRPSPLRTRSSTPTDDLSSGTHTTPSTFSFSRFPQPPPFIDPSLSPPNDENIPPPISTSFTTTAPATPPATPAVVHYRGTSFDLVNPHDSLLLHDIETPSRDFDSSEYLPLRTSEELPGYQEVMAPKRALYGDLSSAHSSITKRADPTSPTESPGQGVPQVPESVVLGSQSSQYSSPTYSGLAVPPLAVKKEESRFSIKRLTRSLTEKLVKTPELPETELEDFSAPRASAHLEGEYPRPLTHSYRTMEELSFQPADLPTESEEIGPRLYSVSPLTSPKIPQQRASSAPLSSMIPDDPSAEAARATEMRTSASEGGVTGKPYYEDLESLYPGSSIYGDEEGGYPPSLHSKRKSNPFGPLSYVDDDTMDHSKRESIYSFSTSARGSRRVSRPLTQDFLRSRVQAPEKTDTLSKFIDHYGKREVSESSLVAHPEEPVEIAPSISAPYGTIEHSPQPLRPPSARVTSGLSQFDFELQPIGTNQDDSALGILSARSSIARRVALASVPGSPPAVPAPLAPPFEYDEVLKELEQRPELSEDFSGDSSYGDTRQLLQLSQPLPLHANNTSAAHANILTASGHRLEPSSSYSQPDGYSAPLTPQEALDEAEKIFQGGSAHEGDEAIPAIWARRSSGNLLRKSEDVKLDEEKEDWETIGIERPSMEDHDDSIADYSSTEDSRASLGTIPESSLPVLDSQPFQRHSSGYRHPSPLPPHVHPFNSSPPALGSRASIQTAPEGGFANPAPANPPTSATAPTLSPGHGAIAPDVWDPPYQYRRYVPHYEMSYDEAKELVDSGPNEEILYEDPQHYTLPTSSSPRTGENIALQRENTFEKMSSLGPKGNLTGTPLGTGMHEVGSSVANTSSPGARWTSSPYHQEGSTGFYVSPDRVTSHTKIRRSDFQLPVSDPQHDRTPSECTIFPSHYRLASLSSQGSAQEAPRSIPEKHAAGDRITNRRSQRFPVSPNYTRSTRAAVPGQTKLREMILAPESLSSGGSERMGTAISDRPSTCNTESPLRRNLESQGTLHSQGTFRTVLANELSPHLLCPERALDPQEEHERRMKSWIIFALFCVLPPMLILYRWMGNAVMATWTNGRLVQCTATPKKVALWAGIAINIGGSGIIIISILVAHAAKLLRDAARVSGHWLLLNNTDFTQATPIMAASFDSGIMHYE